MTAQDRRTVRVVPSASGGASKPFGKTKAPSFLATVLAVTAYPGVRVVDVGSQPSADSGGHRHVQAGHPRHALARP